VQPDLATELAQMQALFVDASELVGLELGMAGKEPEKGATESNADIGITFRKWAGQTATDADLGRDARMMVPIFFDGGRQQTKVWVFLGWTQRSVKLSFAHTPQTALTKAGKPVGKDAPEIRFVPVTRRLSYPVTAEVYVTQLLDRDEFRRHCDRYKTQSAILKNLK
jgi:hypothetical protein